MNALLIIDIQNDFLPGGALAVPKGEEIIAEINTHMRWFPLVVATQDWHPKNHLSFASMHCGRHPLEQIELNGISQVLWPDHCVQGSHGAQLSDALNQGPVEAVFRKGLEPSIDSYSGFYDNGHIRSTGLAPYLKGKGVTELTIVGLAGDYCVNFTAKDALQEGFGTYLILSGIRSVSDSDFATSLASLKNAGAKVFPSFKEFFSATDFFLG